MPRGNPRQGHHRKKKTAMRMGSGGKEEERREIGGNYLRAEGVAAAPAGETE